MTAPFLLCAAITTISACVSLGYSLAALRGRSGEARTLARYASVRSGALAIAACANFVSGSPDWLFAIAMLMVLVQAGDSLVGLAIRNRLKTLGPAVTSMSNLAALAWFAAS